MRAFWHVLALGAALIVLFATLVPSHAQSFRIADVAPVAPLPIPGDLAAVREQPAMGPSTVSAEAGQQQLSEALLANYVARQQQLRSVNIHAEAGGELNADVLMGYISRTTGPGNSAVSAIASFAPQASFRDDSTLSPNALAAYIESSYKPLHERIEHANAERDCLAQAIYHEARGESQAGQLAVANVIVNRARSGKFPASLCGVIYQNADKGRYRCQFTFACDGRSDTPGERRAWMRSAELAEDIYAEFATGEAVGAVPGSTLYYHTTAVHPSWANTYNTVAKIGSHIFYSPN